MYAVEARIFDNGKVISKTRPAENGEQTTHFTDTGCEIWIDVFSSRVEADGFARQYKA